MTGKNNIAAGFLVLGFFMLTGFLLIVMRDFLHSSVGEALVKLIRGQHFEFRLAHVHGGLFSLVNILMGYLLMQLPLKEKQKKIISYSALGGLVMPFGILAEVLFALPPYPVFAGALSISFSAIYFGVVVLRLKMPASN